MGLPFTPRKNLAGAKLLARLGTSAASSGQGRCTSAAVALHTHISWALEAGESSSDIASWVGALLATIEANYRHAKPRTKMGWLDDLDL